MEIIQRITEVVENIKKLKDKCYPKFDLKIGYLTLFSQDENEYKILTESLGKLGMMENANNGVKFILEEKLNILDEVIQSVRVRKPDVHRHELGCSDLVYREEDYENLKNIALEKGFDIILRKDYEMIELSTFDIKAYAYIVK